MGSGALSGIRIRTADLEPGWMTVETGTEEQSLRRLLGSIAQRSWIPPSV